MPPPRWLLPISNRKFKLLYCTVYSSGMKYVIVLVTHRSQKNQKSKFGPCHLISRGRSSFIAWRSSNCYFRWFIRLSNGYWNVRDPDLIRNLVLLCFANIIGKILFKFSIVLIFLKSYKISNSDISLKNSLKLYFVVIFAQTKRRVAVAYFEGS